MIIVQQRFLSQTLSKYLLAFSLLITALCASPAHAASKVEINAYVSEALNKFYKDSPAGKSLAARAKGMLVFPKVYKAGIGIGGAYGTGRVYQQGAYVGDISMTQVSLGFQLGAQGFSQIVFLQDKRAFDEFTGSNFEFGADAGVVVITAGAQAGVSTSGSSAGVSGGKHDASTAGEYYKGMAIFSVAKGGLMFDVKVSGQKFDYQAIH